MSLLPDMLTVEIRKIGLGSGVYVVRARRDFGRVTWWFDGRGDTLEQARANCDALVKDLR